MTHYWISATECVCRIRSWQNKTWIHNVNLFWKTTFVRLIYSKTKSCNHINVHSRSVLDHKHTTSPFLGSLQWSLPMDFNCAEKLRGKIKITFREERVCNWFHSRTLKERERNFWPRSYSNQLSVNDLPDVEMWNEALLNVRSQQSSSSQRC